AVSDDGVREVRAAELLLGEVPGQGEEGGPMTHTLTIARDTHTKLGILPAGMTVLAEPSEDYTAWVVEMSLPRAAGVSHPLTLPSSAVHGGGRRKLEALDQARCAHHDYRFAREW